MVLSGNYELIDESDAISADLLSVYILHNDANIVYQSTKNASRESFHIDTQPGSKYWLCLRSTHPLIPGGSGEGEEEEVAFYENPDAQPRQVGFSFRFHPRHRRISVVAREWADERTGEWLEIASETAEFLTDLKDHFSYVKKREADHRSLVERTFADILAWTLLEAAMVVGVAAGQVLLFRRFLEKKHGY